MSPAGTSVSGPTWRYSSVTKAWQKRITSPGLLALGVEVRAALAAAHGQRGEAFLKVCSKARNFRIDRFTDGWKRRPPL
jgi:hypothetical protein